MSIKIIACIGKNRELGAKNDLCFHIKEDMAFFRNTTTNHPVLMGKNTFLSLRKPLKDRTNYVLTHSPSSLPEDFLPVRNLNPFIKKFKSTPDPLYIIGGASLYKQALPYADELILTEVDSDFPDADVFFPEFDKNLYDKSIIKKGSEDDLTYSFVSYKRK